MLALADGMGGHKGGLESAEAAVTAAMGVLTEADARPRCDGDAAAGRGGGE